MAAYALTCMSHHKLICKKKEMAPFLSLRSGKNLMVMKLAAPPSLYRLTARERNNHHPESPSFDGQDVEKKQKDLAEMTKKFNTVMKSKPRVIARSNYMRQLPITCIQLTSQLGMKMIQEAMAEGKAEGLFHILPFVEGQRELTFCAVASILTVLNTLRYDPNKIWKGSIRWYDENMLMDHSLLEYVKARGITMEEVGNLLQKNSIHFESYLTSESTLEGFRNAVIQACSSTTSFVIASYSRRVLRQTGDGHFSPIGAYHSGTDSVLILDVARYKYPPHWVTCSQLWAAMDTGVSQQKRGYLIIS